MGNIEKDICDLLRQGETFVLATILSQTGSTPRLPGTRMIVRADGSIIGTIGGGLVEAEVMRAAPGIIEHGGAQIRPFNLDQANSDDRMDMICGGNLEMLMEALVPDETVIRIFETFDERSRKGLKSVMVADISAVTQTGGHVRRCLFTDTGELYGNADLPAPMLKTLLEKTRKERSPSVISIEDRKFLAEPSFSAGTVFLFGAGHVSQQTAKLTHMVNFRTVAIDDRAEFANTQRFPLSEEVLVLEDFDRAFEGLEIGEDSYVVILTRGHSHDKTVLEQALRTCAGYIGMIGSKKKRDTIYKSLLHQGFTEEDLKRVYSPIGLTIGAETPEEIAVSIVGELIAVRAGKAAKPERIFP